MDGALFSHPVAEEPRSATSTTPQDDRYGSLFRQPAYTPAPSSEGTADPGPRRRQAANSRAHDPSGRRAHR
ncbi:hypothetical protein [Amycolatopsis nalaikhensis]|uniref:Uncharacterized protein n=1 Tax=Amycolatopsis nalaikhensis TaxID=715472 RepID=A0ABY8XK73_9PSEU|nr:hypothetical protein [Amycolatopsis sp. 2-2]WIV56047.1 hypothetical protein QP939_45845 [Amycolatopsis sp. 2-2]